MAQSEEDVLRIQAADDSTVESTIRPRQIGFSLTAPHKMIRLNTDGVTYRYWSSDVGDRTQDGNISLTAGDRFVGDEVRALSASGLKLTEDGGGDGIKVTDDGAVVIGDLAIGTESFDIARIVTTSSRNNLGIDAFSTTAAVMPIFTLRRSHHATVGSYGETQDGDYLGAYLAQGVSSGSALVPGGRIQFVQSGSAGASSVPTAVQILNAIAGAEGVRMEIIADGGVKMYNLKSGASQVDAGAATDELWVDTADQTIKLGT